MKSKQYDTKYADTVKIQSESHELPRFHHRNYGQDVRQIFRRLPHHRRQLRDTQGDTRKNNRNQRGFAQIVDKVLRGYLWG